jgi:hypothetical protein
MKKISVWKCDFCSEVNFDSEKIKEHEKDCPYNPIYKKCYSCEYHFGDGYTYCALGYFGVKSYNVQDGEDKGNCEGWVSADKQLLRKVKLTKINEIQKG